MAYRAVTITDYINIICHFVNEKYEFLEKRIVSIKSLLNQLEKLEAAKAA